jgi:hypothetical protein
MILTSIYLNIFMMALGLINNKFISGWLCDKIAAYI